MTYYISTRDVTRTQKSFEEVLLAGLASDGGLYVPETLPSIDFDALKGKSYQDIAFAVMKPFVEGALSDDELCSVIEQTYSNKVFRDPAITPLVPLYGAHYVMEQFHGPTLAFKDVALQFLGRVFDVVLKKRDQRITIVGATSGDTGSAAIEGCRHSDRIKVFIMYPQGRVSEVQRRQMTTVLADNVFNLAIEGTFDDCQNMVKAMFADAQFREKMNLSAVNSINWARILAQIVYYVATTLQLSEKSNAAPTFVVPTGNFGNVLAAFYARQMGLKLNLVVATNKNDILTRFFESGAMRAQGVQPTNTPSMDIEISSNFERYLFELLDRDAGALASTMEGFKRTGVFEVEAAQFSKARAEFAAYRASEEDVLAVIKDVHTRTGYTLDPHTAVGMRAAMLVEEDAPGAIVTLGTAHPAKFPDTVEEAIGERPALPDHLSDLLVREERETRLPNDLAAVQAFVAERA